MIGILLNDASYEQDIRELLMAFYPGEGFAHERTGGVDFYVEGTYEPESGTFSLDILENEEKKAGAAFPVSYENRLEAKTAIKRELYGLLSARTGKTLPWGTLTGIRPTKIALSRLDQGVPEEEIREFMEKTYLTSREKINRGAGKGAPEPYRLRKRIQPVCGDPVLSHHLPVLLLYLLPHRGLGKENGPVPGRSF